MLFQQEPGNNLKLEVANQPAGGSVFRHLFTWSRDGQSLPFCHVGTSIECLEAHPDFRKFGLKFSSELLAEFAWRQAQSSPEPVYLAERFFLAVVDYVSGHIGHSLTVKKLDREESGKFRQEFDWCHDAAAKTFSVLTSTSAAPALREIRKQRRLQLG